MEWETKDMNFIPESAQTSCVGLICSHLAITPAIAAATGVFGLPLHYPISAFCPCPRVPVQEGRGVAQHSVAWHGAINGSLCGRGHQ